MDALRLSIIFVLCTSYIFICEAQMLRREAYISVVSFEFNVKYYEINQYSNKCKLFSS